MYYLKYHRKDFPWKTIYLACSSDEARQLQEDQSLEVTVILTGTKDEVVNEARKLLYKPNFA